MKDKMKHKRLLLILIAAMILLPVMASFAEKTKYTYDDVNRVIRVEKGSGTPIITATAGTNGSIYPSGNVAVGFKGNQTFYIDAAFNCYISDVLVDGESKGAITSYPFNNVTASHTIEAIFRSLSECPGSPVKNMRTGALYNTIQSAYNAANAGDTIKSRGVEFTESLNIGKAITLDGGYDCNFTSSVGRTTLHGSINVGSGSFTVNMGNFEIY